MKGRQRVLWATLWIASLASAQFKQPYVWSHLVEGSRLTVEVAIPPEAYLYAEQTSVDLLPGGVAQEMPASESHTDDFGTFKIYPGGKSHRWIFSVDPQNSYRMTVNYQGCGTPAGGNAVCYPPVTETFTIGLANSNFNGSALGLSGGTSRLETLLDRFEVVRSDGGLKGADEFLAFLNLTQEVIPSAQGLAGKSVWLILFLVLLGGLALNFTPCVLPMIPVNLAIIGAGVAAATKRQGFVRGGVYGFGIALAYGALGLFAVLTGSTFGTLNASAFFNFIIAAIFIILALALFDVWTIDFSRFGSRFGNSRERKNSLIPVFVMGVVAALLAGACVAPMVIAVLLQASAMTAGGNPLGFFLPLLLGVGMALPWPFAGAGLTFLPKPGVWMVKVKYGFGVLIVLFALYYAHLGITLLPHTASGYSTEAVLAELEIGLQKALDEDRPVFLDFWASWCKNCLAMRATTFREPRVMDRLHDFQEIKIQAEKPGEPEMQRILNRYNLPGLPGYVILKPVQKTEN